MQTYTDTIAHTQASAHRLAHRRSERALQLDTWRGKKCGGEPSGGAFRPGQAARHRLLADTLRRLVRRREFTEDLGRVDKTMDQLTFS